MASYEDIAAALRRSVLGPKKEGAATHAIESVGNALYAAAAGPSRFVNSHMQEYQPGMSVGDMPQTMEQLPEVAMNVTGAPGMTGGVPGVGMGIRSHHFSPHDFERFDINKIGTGEGAQAYGHGLYFAENPAVTSEYKSKLSTLANPGKTYEVNINADPAHLLDWDKVLNPQMRETFANLMPKRADYFRNPASAPSGQSAYDELTGSLYRNQPAATAALRDAGIPGIKYLDQGSRTAGQGTSNYVMFDDKLIDIIKKYGIPGMFGLGAAELTKDQQ